MSDDYLTDIDRSDVDWESTGRDAPPNSGDVLDEARESLAYIERARSYGITPLEGDLSALVSRLADEVERLREESDDYDRTLGRQGDLLTETVNVLRGDPPELTTWSHHNVPELARELQDKHDQAVSDAEVWEEVAHEARAWAEWFAAERDYYYRREHVIERVRELAEGHRAEAARVRAKEGATLGDQCLADRHQEYADTLNRTLDGGEHDE